MRKENVIHKKCYPELVSGSCPRVVFPEGLCRGTAVTKQQTPERCAPPTLGGKTKEEALNKNASRVSLCSGFTLVELLVVVLIIGILAAVAVPEYQKAVEKARMAEAVALVRTLANANQVFYMENGRYAEKDELNLLDVEIPGSDYKYSGGGIRKQTAYFIYSPNGLNKEYLALAQRIPLDKVYYIYIKRTKPSRIYCGSYDSASSIQRKLCQQLNTNGTL